MKKTGLKKAAAMGTVMALLLGMLPGGSAMASQIGPDGTGNVAGQETSDAGEDLWMPGTGTAASAEGELLYHASPDIPDGEPVRTEPEHAASSYTRDSFFPQVTMQGVFPGTELYFDVPEYWDTKYVYAALEYRVSPLILEAASSLTFYINQVPLSSFRVTYEDGETQIAYVEIPLEYLTEGYNSFSISAYTRVFDWEGCTDDLADANWLSLSDNSYIRCGYELKDYGNDISGFPYPFMSTQDPTGEGLSVAISDAASDGEAAAVLTLMAALRDGTQEEDRSHLTLLSDLHKQRDGRTILISLYDNLPDSYRKKLSDTKGVEDHALLEFTDDDDGDPLLIITSQDESCLLDAVYMLTDEERLSQEKGDFVKVAKSPEATSGTQSDSDTYTLDDLNGTGLSFVGPFHQEQYIYLPSSGDYYLSDVGKLSLYFRYSENLDFNRSLVTVYWGSVPVASKKLSKDGAAGDELVFNMPADVVGTGAGSIRIAFDLELPDMFCTLRQEQMPWAYIAGESVFYLPSSGPIALTFGSVPSLFIENGRFNDVLLVLPDQPDSGDLDLFGQFLGRYAENISPSGSLEVKRAGALTDRDLDRNIITVGTYGNNSFLRKVNDELHFKYAEDGERFTGNEQLVLSEDYAGHIAILQLISSPYGTSRGILALTGTSEQSMAKAEEFMRDKTAAYQTGSDCLIIDEKGAVKTFLFAADALQSENLSLTQTISQNRQSVLFTLVATSVMLMLLIAVILILLRIKHYHKRKALEE